MLLPFAAAEFMIDATGRFVKRQFSRVSIFSGVVGVIGIIASGILHHQAHGCHDAIFDFCG